MKQNLLNFKLFFYGIIFSIYFGACSQTMAESENKETTSSYVQENYTKKSYYIAMRDGVKLYTTVYSPKDTLQTYPILFNRTPYGIKPYGENVFPEDLGPSYIFEKEKYIFVYQDVRGKFLSEGEFVDVRPLLNDTINRDSIDESTDAYDSIDWLIKNIKNNNGNVGMWGISYPGFYAACALVKPHVALKAVSPQAPIADWFWDDFHHNGAFFLPHFFHFYSVFGQERPNLVTQWPERLVQTTQTDGYKFFLNEVGALQNIDPKFYKNKVKFWHDVQNHPNYDQFWQKRSILPHLKNIKTAVLLVGGLFDAEDLFGPLKIYQSIEANNPKNESLIVLGPWIHGGWARTDGTSLGTVSFKNGDKTPSDYYQHEIEFPFFQYYLNNKKKPSIAEATIYRTGENKWEKFDSWYPTKIEKQKLYFGDKTLSFSAYTDADNNSYDEFISNPNQPVPSSEKPSMRMEKEYMVANQKYLVGRDDVLTYETEILSQDIRLIGNILANLYVSTDQEDADWIVKIIDVYPENFADFTGEDGKITKMGNFHQLVRSEIFRGRFRNSFEFPEAFIPNEETLVRIELLDLSHTFQKGHKIMVQIHSSWFPMVDRNPQKWVNNIYKDASSSDFIEAKHRLYRNKKYPTSLEVSVLKK